MARKVVKIDEIGRDGHREEVKEYNLTPKEAKKLWHAQNKGKFTITWTDEVPFLTITKTEQKGGE
jgi:hypothetical protein